MRRRVLVGVLALVFAAALVASTILLGSYPTPPGVEFCDSAGQLTTIGQDPYVGDSPRDPAEIALCNEAGRVPGTIGWVIAAVGFASGVAWLTLVWRGRRGRPHGEPISRARRVWDAR
jgi:hypothetical protein